MRVLVWGLGYVGTVTAACAAELGHEVFGVDTSKTKVDAINAGRCAIKEPGLEDLVSRMVRAGRLEADTSGSGRVVDTDLSLVCVGTPSAPDGGPVLDYLKHVTADIAAGMASSRGYHVVVIRSTVFPGTARRVLLPLLEQGSGRIAGEGFGLASNPEFLREATAIRDFYETPYTIIGELDERAGSTVASMYEGVKGPVHRVALEEAELLKLANNAFHALKIGFANEIGRLGHQAGVDSQLVMRLVCADRKLNVSEAYLRPGFAFGGSCLPKDLRSLLFHSRRLGVDLPILDGVLRSNREQIEAARVQIHAVGVRRVAILGLGFKPGTDDLRESPVIALVRDLWQDGFDLAVHDPDLSLGEMLGSNREYLERQLPQIESILHADIADALKGRELAVITQERRVFREALSRMGEDTRVLDLVAGPLPALKPA
jgi:GDP-mannose 6-dehydrogenase